MKHGCLQFPLIAAVLVLIAAEDARAADRPPCELSAFADVVYASRESGPDPALIALNQAELGAGFLLAPDVAFNLAPSWDGESVGLATAHVRMGACDPAEHLFSRHVCASGLVVGRFDVPFGIDWLHYASIDRPLITAPEAVAGTHGGWNADGVMYVKYLGRFNVLAHLTGRGGDAERATADGTLQEWRARHAEGARLGFVPGGGLSLGGSLARIAATGDRERILAGADLQYGRGPVDVRAEYIRQRADADGTRYRDDAWYVQGRWDLGPAYGVVRWDVLLAEEEPARRLSLGAGVPVNPWVTLRGEYRADLVGDDDTLYLQFAMGY